MPFAPGNSGNPRGQLKVKEFAQALRLAVNEAAEKGGTKLRALADKLVEEGLAGNVNAIKEVGNRLDGKPAQQVMLSGDEEDPIRYYVVLPKKAATTEEWMESIRREDAGRSLVTSVAAAVDDEPTH